MKKECAICALNERNHNGFFYGLEKHLASFSSIGTLYEELYCYWVIQKKDYIKRLQAVTTSYPGYSLHDASHSEKIVQAIELVLGENRIKELSATDTWMLLECAYAHDIGMVIPISDFINDLLSEEEDSFYNYIEQFHSKSFKLSHAIEFIYPLLYGLRSRKNLRTKDMGFYFSVQDERQLLSIFDNKDEAWPVQFRNALESLAQAYYRPKHGSRAKKIIYSLVDRKDFPQVVPRRLRYLVGDIAFMHTENRTEILNILEYVTSGISNDYTHPRFVAEMLRLGDLLDLDAERFNPYQLSVTGNIDIFSMEHQIKHLSITQLLISPKEIRLQANFKPEKVTAYFTPDENNSTEKNTNAVNEFDKLYSDPRHLCIEAIKTLSAWLKMLRMEIEFFSSYWFKLVPTGFPGAAPFFSKEEIIFEGKYIDIDELSLIYSIDTRRAAELVEGSNMYRNPGLVFLRELIQNAIDASKLQLFRDIKGGIYSYDGINEFLLSTPYDLHIRLKNQLNRYKIDLFIKTNDKSDSVEIVIRDYGIGITLEKLKRMKHIGNAFSARDYKLRQNMPVWLQPTGSFGFGMQSVFRVVKSFTLRTCARDELDSMGQHIYRKASFFSARMGGEIYSDYMSKKEASEFGFGTEIKIVLQKDDIDFLFWGDKVSPEAAQDPYCSRTTMLKKLVKHYVKENCVPTIFPIWIDNRPFISVKSSEMFGNFVISCGNGKYELIKSDEADENKKAFSYWDMQTGIIIHYKPFEDDGFGNKDIFNKMSQNTIYLKGIMVDDMNMVRITRMPLFDTSVNLLGFDAKEYLQISRDSFLPEKYLDVANQIRMANIRFMNALMRLFDSDYKGFLSDFFGENEVMATILRYIAWLGISNCTSPYDNQVLLNMCQVRNNGVTAPKIPFYLIEKNELTYYGNEAISAPEWFTDFTYFSIDAMLIDENFYNNESNGIKVAIDCWKNYSEIAMSEIEILMLSGAKEYMLVYKLSYRKKQPVTMNEEMFWKYVGNIVKNAVKKFSADGKDTRLLVPGIVEYISLSVCKVQPSLLTYVNHRFMSWIILPLSIGQIKSILDKSMITDDKLMLIREECKKILNSKDTEELLNYVSANSLNIDSLDCPILPDRVKDDYMNWLEKLFMRIHSLK